MQKRTYPLTIAVSLLAFLTAGIGMLLVVPLDFGASPWQNFDLLAVDQDQSVPELSQALTAAGRSPVDRYTATVQVENFTGKIEIPVATLHDHFDPDDPRFDPFLQALPGLFYGRSGEQTFSIVYLPGDGTSLGRRYLELSRILGDFQFHLVGWDPIPAGVSGVAAVLVVLLALSGTRYRWWTVVAGGVLTVVYATAGGSASLIRGAMVLTVWALWQDRAVPAEREWLSYGTVPIRDRDYRFFLVTLVVVVLAAFFTFRLETTESVRPAVAAYLLYLAGIAAVSSLAFLLLSFRYSRMEHRPFFPRAILTVDTGRVPRSGPAFVCLVLVVSQLSIAVLQDAGKQFAGVGETIVPVPELFPERGLVAGTILEEARLLAPEHHPLSTAGYLAHRRFQESLIFGGTFAVPDLDEVVALVRFSRDQGRIRDFQEPVITFDAEWVARQLSPESRSAYQLITREGATLIITKRALPGQSASPGQSILLILVALVGFSPLMYGWRLPCRSQIDTVGLASRSASQEA